jgi:hypothetical protein
MHTQLRSDSRAHVLFPRSNDDNAPDADGRSLSAQLLKTSDSGRSRNNEPRPRWT